MPAGIPVATVAIGNATNAGLLAVQILATQDPKLSSQVQSYRQSLKEMVLEKQAKLAAIGHHNYFKE
jgi:5-(carboxyamino)imidazole ribonucleotide mutase